MNKKIILIIIFIIFVILAVPAFLQLNGYIWHTEIFTWHLDVKGLDVSHHQGTIDWEKVPKEKYKFVFIKASEGMDHADREFKNNWKKARELGFVVGAYHFFVTTSTGRQQAENFISIVPVMKDSLPPVIDVEVDIRNDATEVRKELSELIDSLKNHYKKIPVLYVTHDTYETFVLGHFNECPVWIRNIFMYPCLSDGRRWTFWQFSHRGRVPGINGFVDINAYHSGKAEFNKLITASQ